MKNKSFFLVLVTFVMILSSCNFERIEPIDDNTDGKLLDVQKLLEQKSKWQALNIKNYTFTYRFRDNMNKTGRYKEYKGIVIVENGEGKLRFDKRLRIPSRYNPSEKKFFITCIEDVFDNILEDYLLLKKRKDEGKIDYLNVSYEWYEFQYFFLERIAYTPFKFSSTTGPRRLDFQIIDFNVF